MQTQSPAPTSPGSEEEAALAQTVRDLGRSLTPELLKGSQQLYAGRHEAEPYAGVILHRDLQYGPDSRNRLDVFQPEQPAPDRPILLFVHGGGFVRGDKKNPGLPYFDNIGLWAARRGLLGITMTYRLAPQHKAPAGRDDVAAALSWIEGHAAAHGGNPRRIILMGHSAGAVLVACHLAACGREIVGVAGAILASGMYDFARLTEREGVRAYFGEEFPQHSPLNGLRDSPVPVMVAVAEHDPRDFQQQALALVTALLERDESLPRFVRQSGQNHYTACFRIGCAPDDPIEREIEAFIAENCGSQER